MDWKNIDLNSSYERGQSILDSYNLETLFLEIHCNFKEHEITQEKIKSHYQAVMLSKLQCALEVFEANLDNITKEAIKQRKAK